MRIAFFADNFYPELSGIVDSILITGKELMTRGHEVVYVGPHYSPKDYALVGKQCMEENGSEVIDGMKVLRLPSVPLPYSPTGQSHFAFPSGKAVQFLREWKPDIIHTNSPYGCGFEAKKAARKLKIPLVGTNHTPIEEFYPHAPILMRRFDAWYYNHCDFASAPFENLLKNMRAAGFKKDGHAVPNPVVHALFNPPTSEEKKMIREKFGFEGPVILYAGRVAAEKHLDLVIESVKELLQTFPNIRFVITGHGSAAASLKSLAQELKMAEHVLFTGFLPSENLALYYKAADVFTIMSTADSQSIALMQAYATGIPAVGARAHGLPDYIPADCGFLVEPGDVDSLTKHLKELLENDALREKMGQAGLKFVETMSPEKIADEWESIYKKLIPAPLLS